MDAIYDNNSCSYSRFYLLGDKRMKIELPLGLEERIQSLEDHIERIDKVLDLIIKELDNEL